MLGRVSSAQSGAWFVLRCGGSSWRRQNAGDSFSLLPGVGVGGGKLLGAKGLHGFFGVQLCLWHQDVGNLLLLTGKGLKRSRDESRLGFMEKTPRRRRKAFLEYFLFCWE